MKNQITIGLAAIVLIVLIYFVITLNHRRDLSYIENWASENNYAVEVIEKPWVSTGPYWVREDYHRIYKVEIKNQDKDVWFRFGTWFGPNIEWY